MVYSSDTVKEALGDLLPLIGTALDRGFGEFQRMRASAGAVISPRTRASLARDYIAEQIKRDLVVNGRLVMRKQRGVELFVTKTGLNVCLRIKKLDRNLLGHNAPTQQALRYAGQLDIPGLVVDYLHLNLGYCPDSLWGEIRVYVTCPNGLKSNAWVIPLDTNVSTAAGLESLMEQAPAPSPRVRLKPKQRTLKKQSNG